MFLQNIASLPAHVWGCAEHVQDTRALIVESVRKSQRIGVGLQGEVYCFATEDRFFEQFLLKRIRLITDIPGQDEASFHRKFKKATALVPQPSALDGYNFGQPLWIDDTRSIMLLLRQHGMPLDKVIAEDIPALRGKTGSAMTPCAQYHLYLDWLIHDVPDTALIDFAQKIRRVKAAGLAVDHVKKDNIFWDAARTRFELIDLFSRYRIRDVFNEEKRYQAVQRPVQVAYAILQGVADPALDTRQELFKLLTYDLGHWLQAGTIRRTAEEKAATHTLETRLAKRIAALDIARKEISMLPLRDDVDVLPLASPLEALKQALAQRLTGFERH